jgi:hypothetical protein
MVIEASIVARLLRLRLLTVDASILLLPAGAARSDDARRTARPAAAVRGGAGRRLSDAIRTIDEAEHGLARARVQEQLALRR